MTLMSLPSIERVNSAFRPSRWSCLLPFGSVRISESRRSRRTRLCQSVDSATAPAVGVVAATLMFGVGRVTGVR
ncbi:MAG: hypothetical protein V9E87_17140 [Gemmatimonadales bacterium]